MAKPVVTVVDYGMGNIWSVLNALRYLGSAPLVSANPDEIARAEALLLPGVGSFHKAMTTLHRTGIDQAILGAVSKGTNLLGVCLGMQLLANHGSEDGYKPGLGLIPNPVDMFTMQEVGSQKIPHVGFNRVRIAPDTSLFKGLPDAADFYFVHSYRILSGGLSGKISTCVYGIEFLAAYEKDNIYATQFHPEKSQTNGLVLLQNFLAL